MKKMILLFSFVLTATVCSFGITVSGVVTDAQNNPLPGVNVVEEGTSNGTVTDLNGKYTIKVRDNNATLVFSYIGYATEKKQVNNSTTLDVQLTEDVTELEEVMVVGYGTQRKMDVTGAVSTVSDSRHKNMQPAPHHHSQQFNTESYSTIHENGFKDPMHTPLSTFSIDVDAASYSNVRRFINDGRTPPVDAVRIEEMINYFDYDYEQPNGEHPFRIYHELGNAPWNENNKLLHIGLQGKEMHHDEAPPSNLVFLIDVSGSMNAPNKLPLLKKAFSLLVDQLRDEDRVAIVVYASNTGLVLPSTPGSNKEKIKNAIDRLHAGGSTAGSAGLKQAYEVAEEHFIENGNNRIILATDGDFNVGPSSNAEMERMIEKYREKNIFISVTGFGMGNYKDDKMEIIADKGNGNYAYIDNLLEAKKVFINEFSSTLYTIAKDVKIQIEFNPVHVAEYRLIGYENRLLNDEDFADDTKDAGELGAGHTVTALYEIVPRKQKDAIQRKLKYQQSELHHEQELSGELATVQFRYKKPEATTSILMEETIEKEGHRSEPSDNFSFSTAVAGYGMLLRNSEFKGDLDYKQILNIARKAKGDDHDGYRQEFIRMVELTDLL